jgi:hypothetical protein
MPWNFGYIYGSGNAQRVMQQRAKVERKRREKWEAMKAAMIRKRTDAARAATTTEGEQ